MNITKINMGHANLCPHVNDSINAKYLLQNINFLELISLSWGFQNINF